MAWLGGRCSVRFGDWRADEPENSKPCGAQCDRDGPRDVQTTSGLRNPIRHLSRYRRRTADVVSPSITMLRLATREQAGLVLADRVEGRDRRAREFVAAASDIGVVVDDPWNIIEVAPVAGMILDRFVDISTRRTPPVWTGLQLFDSEHWDDDARWLADVICDAIADRLLAMSPNAAWSVWIDDNCNDYLVPIVDGLTLPKNPLRLASVAVMRQRSGNGRLEAVLYNLDRIASREQPR